MNKLAWITAVVGFVCIGYVSAMYAYMAYSNTKRMWDCATGVITCYNKKHH